MPEVALLKIFPLKVFSVFRDLLLVFWRVFEKLMRLIACIT